MRIKIYIRGTVAIDIQMSHCSAPMSHLWSFIINPRRKWLNIIPESVTVISRVWHQSNGSRTEKPVPYIISQRYYQRQTCRRLAPNIPCAPDTNSKLDRDNETGDRLKSFNRRAQVRVLTNFYIRQRAGTTSLEAIPEEKRSRSLLSRRCNRRAGVLIGKTCLSWLYIELDAFVYCIKLSRFVPFDPAAPDGGGGDGDGGGFHDAERPGDSISTIPRSSTFDIVTYIIATYLLRSRPRWHVGIHKARPKRRARQIYRLIS